jgi:hypothetical protein
MKKSAEQNNNSSHNYLNTQKSNAHTKINGNLVQLWFGSAAIQQLSPQGINSFGQRFIRFTRLIPMGINNPKPLASAVSNICKAGKGLQKISLMGILTSFLVVNTAYADAQL